MSSSERLQQPVVQLHLHSSDAASRLAALLLPHILPVCSVVAPCQPGASPLSVLRWTRATGCWSPHWEASGKGKSHAVRTQNAETAKGTRFVAENGGRDLPSQLFLKKPL